MRAARRARSEEGGPRILEGGRRGRRWVVCGLAFWFRVSQRGGRDSGRGISWWRNLRLLVAVLDALYGEEACGRACEHR